MAALGKHLHVLHWVRENGLSWDERVCEYVCSPQLHLRLDILTWARANGAPWTEETRQYAATQGYTDEFPLTDEVPPTP